MKVLNSAEPAVTKFSELQPFFLRRFSQWSKSKRCLSYRLPLTSEKGAIFMIVFNFLFATAIWACTNGLYKWECVLVAALCPFISLVADCWIGKYRLIKLAMYVLFLTMILYNIYALILYHHKTLYYIKTILLGCSVAFYMPCIVHFTIDQLLGHSGEQIGFTVYWLIWGNMAGVLVGYALKYFPLFGYINFVMLGILSISTLTMVLMMECCNHWINTTPQLFNPIRHIAQVLNYARKHKYPVRRNAISCWEEDQPSRIDLGKDKYGGPFTVEEVEDVKTMFKLIPLILCTASLAVSLWTKRRLTFTTKANKWYNQSSIHSSIILGGLISILGLPLYQFFFYPLFYNFIPSMLQRIGFGIFLQLPSLLCSAVMELPQTFNSTVEPRICNTTDVRNLVNQWWEMVPIVLDSMSGLLIVYSGAEFVFAQTPCRIKGVVMYFALGCVGFYAVLGYVLDHFLQKIRTSKCGFYSYITYACIMCVVFLSFLFISKWYQLRDRKDAVSHHTFAEDYFDRNH